jgi:hypothetical protein
MYFDQIHPLNYTFLIATFLPITFYPHSSLPSLIEKIYLDIQSENCPQFLTSCNREQTSTSLDPLPNLPNKTHIIYNISPLLREDIFQDLQWILETIGSTEPYICCFFLNIHTYFLKKV